MAVTEHSKYSNADDIGMGETGMTMMGGVLQVGGAVKGFSVTNGAYFLSMQIIYFDIFMEFSTQINSGSRRGEV